MVGRGISRARSFLSSRFLSIHTIEMASSTELRWVNARPDDMHHHLRDGHDALACTVSHVTSQFARCIVMPNLVPPITTTEEALAYRERIMTHVSVEKRESNSSTGFEPLMTLYMTDGTSADEIRRAAATNKIVAVKLYPGTYEDRTAAGAD